MNRGEKFDLRSLKTEVRSPKLEEGSLFKHGGTEKMDLANGNQGNTEVISG